MQSDKKVLTNYFAFADCTSIILFFVTLWKSQAIIVLSDDYGENIKGEVNN